MADTFHRTRSAPDGKPTIGCISNAIADAGLTPDDIDYINPHGTGTPENDKNEYISIAAVFGERAKSIPISSNKSMIGHTLSAAGAVEAVFSLMTLEHQRIPPTINYAVPDPAIPLDVVPNVARDAQGDPCAVELIRLRRTECFTRARTGAALMADTVLRRVLVTGGGRGLGAAIVQAARGGRARRDLHLPLGQGRSRGDARPAAGGASAAEIRRASGRSRRQGRGRCARRDAREGRPLLGLRAQCRPVLRHARRDARPGQGRGRHAGEFLVVHAAGRTCWCAR